MTEKSRKASHLRDWNLKRIIIKIVEKFQFEWLIYKLANSFNPNTQIHLKFPPNLATLFPHSSKKTVIKSVHLVQK